MKLKTYLESIGKWPLNDCICVQCLNELGDIELPEQLIPLNEKELVQYCGSFAKNICSKLGTCSTPSVNEIERLISFQDLWIRHPQRPQGHKRHLAQAIVMFLENRNK